MILGSAGNSGCRALGEARNNPTPFAIFRQIMELTLVILWLALFAVALAAGWVMTVLALPGNWIIVGAAAIYATVVPVDEYPHLGLGWPVVGALALLAVIGELVEMAAAASGVRQAGGSWSSALLALFGSVVGAVIGTIVGVPIPIVGSLVGAIVFAGLGAAAGAVFGESLLGRGWDETRQIGLAAFRGRLLGTLAKMLVGTAMVGVAIGALILG